MVNHEGNLINRSIYVNKYEFNKGSNHIRKLTSGVSIDQPILKSA